MVLLWEMKDYGCIDIWRKLAQAYAVTGLCNDKVAQEIISIPVS